MTIHIQPADFDSTVLSLRTHGTIAVTRQGPDGHVTILTYHAHHPRVVNGNSRQGRRAIADGADIAASLKDRTILIAADLQASVDEPASFCGCASDSHVCQCAALSLVIPPQLPGPISSNHPEMSRNLQAETCGSSPARSAAQDNFQRVLDNHRWDAKGEDIGWQTASHIKVIMRGHVCDDCGAALIATMLTGYEAPPIQSPPQWRVRIAAVARPDTERSACWIAGVADVLQPCTQDQHRYWLGVADPSFSLFDQPPERTS